MGEGGEKRMIDVHYSSKGDIQLHEKTNDSNIDRLLKGSIDMHIHFGPDPLVPRRYDALETAKNARESGLRGIVLKSHSYQTAPLAKLVSELVPGIEVFGSICLDHECGGLNPHAVEASAKLGAKVVWMPVLSAINSRSLATRILGRELKGSGISIIGNDGKLTSEVLDILKIVIDHDMILGTGHISSREIFALVEASKKLGMAKIIVTHATSSYISESILSLEERKMLAKEGILMEHTAWEISPTGGKVNPEDIASSIKTEGSLNCIMSTDLGGMHHPSEAEGMRMFISVMLKCGLNEEEITYMVKTNPARLMGL
jgi:predicted TIM-barrel fold metal-dependent hydrolase